MITRLGQTTISIAAILSMHALAGCDPAEGSGDGGGGGTSTTTEDPGTTKGPSTGGSDSGGAGGSTMTSQGGSMGGSGGANGGSGGVGGGSGGANGGSGGVGGDSGGSGGSAGGSGGVGGGSGGANGGSGGVGGGSGGAMIAVCGDGLVQDGEQCDDGNLSDADGCTAVCKLPVCGDGVVSFGEACDDHNDDDSDACLSTCEVARCGDGFLRHGAEACDDGNVADADGCNADCVVSGSLVLPLEDRPLSGFEARASSVAVDAQGNVAVVGSKQGDGAWVRSIDGSGALRWLALYSGPFGGKTEALGVTTDSHRNVIVCGSQVGEEGDRDIWVRKLDPDGHVLWTWSFDDAGGDDTAYSVTTDSADRVVVAGSVTGEKGADIVVVALDEQGAELWIDRIEGAAGGSDRALGVTATAMGELVVAGSQGGEEGPVPWLAKLGPDGAVAWQVLGGDLLGAQGEVSSVAMASWGKIVVSGAETKSGDADLVVAEIDIDGNPLWTKRFAGASGLSDVGHGVAVDAAGDIVVCGEEGAPNGPTGLLRKYSPAGDLRWASAPFDASARTGVLHACAAGGLGEIATAGEKPDTFGGSFAVFSLYAR